jgi:hypothetical protein
MGAKQASFASVFALPMTHLLEPILEPNDDSPVTHPELLDKLAQELIKHKFDQKFLIRALVHTKVMEPLVSRNPPLSSFVDGGTPVSASPLSSFVDGGMPLAIPCFAAHAQQSSGSADGPCGASQCSHRHMNRPPVAAHSLRDFPIPARGRSRPVLPLFSPRLAISMGRSLRSRIKKMIDNEKPLGDT